MWRAQQAKLVLPFSQTQKDYSFMKATSPLVPQAHTLWGKEGVRLPGGALLAAVWEPARQPEQNYCLLWHRHEAKQRTKLYMCWHSFLYMSSFWEMVTSVFFPLFPTVDQNPLWNSPILLFSMVLQKCPFPYFCTGLVLASDLNQISAKIKINYFITK